MRKWLLALLLLVPGVAFGQGAVLQQGSVFKGHLPMWLSNGYVADAGGPLANGLSPVNSTNGLLPLGMGWVNSGLGLCGFSNYASSPYYTLCLGFDGNGNGEIAYDHIGGAAGSFNFVINGVSYPFPGPGLGNVIGPASPLPVAGDAVAWNGSLTVKDAGAPPSMTVANIAALKALSLVGKGAGFSVGVTSYLAIGDMPPSAYYLATSPCSLAAGAGDGFSQIPSNTAGNCWLIAPSSVYDVRQAGVVAGGTDPNNTNTAQINAVLNYVASFPSASTSTSGFPRVTCGGQFIGFSVGVITIPGGPSLLQSCDFKLIGANSSLVAGDGSYVNRTIYTRSSGALTVPQWTPPDPYPTNDPLPVAMVNVLQTSNFQHITIKDVSIDCNFQANCAALNNGSASTYLQNVNLFHYTTYGLFTTGAWNWTDGTAQESGDPTQWTGYGIYCAGGRLTGTTVDSLTKGVVISESGVNVYANTQCGDFHLDSSHVWIGLAASSNFGAFSGAVNMILTAAGRYEISGNTFDQGGVVFLTGTGGVLPQAVFNNNIFEASGSTNDGWLVLQCGKPVGTGSCANSAGDLNSAVVLSGQSYAKLSAPVYFPITLEDVNGNYNPGAWSQNIQRQAGAGNLFNAFTTPIVNTIMNQTGATFTGNIATGTFNITNVSVFPARGTAVTDNGGCLGASTTLMDISLDQNTIWLAGPNAPTGNCAGDTLTIGGVTFTATVSTGIWKATITSATAWLQPGVHLTDSGACIPANSWIAGYNMHTSQLLFTNDVAAGPAPASGTCNGDTFTATPSTYYAQPQDAGNYINLYNSTTLGLISNMQAGWGASLNVRAAVGTSTILPLGGAQINSTITSSFALPDGVDAVDTLLSASTSMYSLVFGLNNISKPPISLSGFGAGAAFVPAAPTSSAAFTLNVGTTAGNSGVIHLPVAVNGWVCNGSNTSTPTNNLVMRSSTVATATIGNYVAGVAQNFADGAILAMQCTGY